MDTATPLVHRSVRTDVPTVAAVPAEAAQTLDVTATFQLSEDGRKASLLSGGDGRAAQEVAIRVPANRLHLVSVDKQGVARLKLRPRFEVGEGQNVVRVESAPTFDLPPSIDDLFRAASRNHELEQAYFAGKSTERAKRRDAQQELREQVAQAFLAEPSQRAIVHPPPSPNRCIVLTARGRMFFDVDHDTGAAQKVPSEAHRRFRSDLRSREERVRQDRATQAAVHGAKKQFIADWIASYGTPEQQVRHADGVLPMNEAVEGITDQAFAHVGDKPRYVRDGAGRLQAHLRAMPQFKDAVVSESDLLLSSHHAAAATQDQWAFVRQLRVAMPDASVILRLHRLASKHHKDAPGLVLVGALVICKRGPFTLRREYLVPEGGDDN